MILSLDFTSFEYVGDEIFSLDDGMMQFVSFVAPIYLVLLHLQANTDSMTIWFSS